MTMAETRKLATYYSKVYRSTQDNVYREALSYLRTKILIHNINKKKNENQSH